MRSQEEAMRIMEALSGVDEELLARCTGKKSRRNAYRRQYLSRCAAVLALAAVGAVSWRGLRLSKDMTADGSSSNAGPETVMMDYRLNPDPEAGDIAGAADGSNSAGATDALDRSELSDGLNGSGVQDLFVEADKMQAECEVSAARKLAEEEARQVELLGDYVPAVLPAGYVFESARYEAEMGRLTVCWCRGMDDIMLSIEQADGAAVGTVGIENPEAYDERLYEIPFADTVPEEYRETFFDPVFARDDFSLEIVRSRVLSYSGDSGDTATPRGNFSVLYDGVLVHFNGRGTPEEIWEMFASISE